MNYAKQIILAAKSKMKQTFLVFAGFLSLLPINVQSFVSYSLLEDRAGNSVLILGLYHREGANDFNRRNLDKFLTRIDQLSTHSHARAGAAGAAGENEIFCFFENDQYTVDYFRTHKQFPSNYDLDIITATLVQKMISLDNGPFIFQNVEPRDISAGTIDGHEGMSAHVNGIMNALDSFFINMQMNNINEFWNEPVFGRLRQEFMKENITIKNYFDTLALWLDQMQAWQKSYAAGSPAYRSFGDMIERFMQRKKVLEFYTNDFDASMNFSEGLFTILERYKSTKDAFQIFKTLLEIILFDLDVGFADAGFLHTVLQKQRQRIPCKIMLIVGNAHVEKITPILKSLGFEENSRLPSMSVLTFIKELNAYNLKDDGSFKLKLDIALCSFILGNVPDALSFIQESANKSSIQSNVRSCGGCGKRETAIDKLKACARCRKALYCGRDCQQKDWREHKKVCTQS